VDQEAFQDLIPDNLCFGCGPHNEAGLRIKSFWDGDEAVCIYHPQPHQTAGPREYLNGGVIATIIDCHCMCTATANAYKVEQRPIGSEPSIWCVTGTLEVRYLRPTAINQEVHLRARIVEASPKKTVLHCVLSSAGEVCAEAEVVAVQVPGSWRRGG
jgi:acyl-coenzyme A thioesterase PaaI-like protein